MNNKGAFRNNHASVDEIAGEVMHDTSTMWNDNSKKNGIKTGFRDLDQAILGLHPAELVIIAGRPAMGKTAFIRDMIYYMGIYDKRRVLLFNLNENKGQFIKKLIFSAAHVCSSDYDYNNLTSSELEACLKENLLFIQSDIFVDDTPKCTVEMICEKCRSYKAKHDIEIVFIDYLQLVSSIYKTNSRQKEMSHICSELKKLAMELDVPIVVLSQVSRAVEQRKSHRPKISDLSCSVGEDSVDFFDVILFLYRHDYYHSNSYRKGIAELIIARARETKKRRSCLFLWLPQYLKFANLDRM